MNWNLMGFLSICVYLKKMVFKIALKITPKATIALCWNHGQHESNKKSSSDTSKPIFFDLFERNQWENDLILLEFKQNKNALAKKKRSVRLAFNRRIIEVNQHEMHSPLATKKYIQLHLCNCTIHAKCDDSCITLSTSEQQAIFFSGFYQSKSMFHSVEVRTF